MFRNWYWRNWRERDNLKGFADLWERDGIRISVACMLFMIATLFFFL
jgi:hypothetical protein